MAGLPPHGQVREEPHGLPVDIGGGAHLRRHPFGMLRITLPTSLGDAFAVSAARALDIGESRLRGSDLARPFHGARLRTSATSSPDARLPPWEREREDVLLRIASYTPVMPDRAFFVGPTAALLHRIPLPAGIHDELHVGFLHPGSAPRRPGIRGVQVLPHMVRVVNSSGHRVSSPASTWAMLGRTLGPYDLVAAADAILRVPRMPGGYRRTTESARASRDNLTAALAAGRRLGAASLRAALERARPGSSSRAETWLRLALVDGGLPEPELDRDILGPNGEFLGCSELVYPRERIAVEYESDRHLTRAQLERDIDKYEAYASVGWRIVRLTNTHVFRAPREAVRRVAAALASRR